MKNGFARTGFRYRKFVVGFSLFSMVVLFVNCGGFQVDENAALDRQTLFSSRTIFARSLGQGQDGVEAEVIGLPTTSTSVPVRASPTYPTWANTPGSSSQTFTQRSPPPGANSTMYCTTWGSVVDQNDPHKNWVVTRAVRLGRKAFLAYYADASVATPSCAFEVNLQDLISSHHLNFPNCAALSGKQSATVDLTVNPGGERRSYGSLAFAGGYYDYEYSIQFDTSGAPIHAPELAIHYALNGGYRVEDAYDINAASAGYLDADYGDQGNCYQSSPLVVQIGRNEVPANRLRLSAVRAGIDFDILGDNSFPVAHAKKRISWLTAESRVDNYFLVLPNANGVVSGIDDMFGDNTHGPDGGFAANGYEALRKYDGVNKLGGVDAKARNGVIDTKDAVFQRLRLWSDLNGDGLSQAHELFTLPELGVRSMSLDFDPNYREIDEYGNSILMKSTVTMESGELNVVYDLWFKLGD
jgi:hypothetical protein